MEVAVYTLLGLSEDSLLVQPNCFCTVAARSSLSGLTILNVNSETVWDQQLIVAVIKLYRVLLKRNCQLAIVFNHNEPNNTLLQVRLDSLPFPSFFSSEHMARQAYT